jgi:hypothetical protein
MMHIVIIEWDGQAVPTAYYDRLRKLALKVRTQDINDKGLSPLLRRFSGGLTPEEHNKTKALDIDGRGPGGKIERTAYIDLEGISFVRSTGTWVPGHKGSGIIIQEGCIVCASEHVARMVATLASDYGAKSVHIGTAEIGAWKSTEEDEKILARINAVFGRRGRPPPSETFTVTCLEEMMSFTIEATGVAVCPNCSSPLISVSEGELPTYFMDRANDPFHNWLESRFATGQYHVPNVTWDKGKGQKPHPTNLGYPSEYDEVITKMRNSKRLLESIRAYDKYHGYQRWLDELFSSQVWTAKEVRTQHRILSIAAYVRKTRAGSGAPPMLTGKEYDEFDNARLTPDDCVDWLLKFRKMEKAEV